MEQLRKKVCIREATPFVTLHKKLLSLLSLSLSLFFSPAAVGASVATATGSTEECFLCDAPVDVKFEPCGHAILCHECAERAKKCLKCKV